MSGTLAIVSPTGIDLLAGTPLASLDFLPPCGLALTDTGAGISVSVTLDSTSTLSASSAGGATVSGSGGTLTITGSLAEVNTALASLALADTTAGTGTLSVVATDGTLSASTTLSVTTLPDSPPAFLAPPASLALTAGIATTLGLTLADDAASALNLIGSAPETLAVTLIASDGALLLDPSSYPSIGIAGDATGALALTATGADLTTLNAALGAVALDARSTGTVEYIARRIGGPLAGTVTSGSLDFGVTGTVATGAASWLGGAGTWQSGSAWSGGAVPGLGTDATIGSFASIAGYGIADTLLVGSGAVTLDGDFSAATVSLDPGASLLIAGGLVSAAGTLDLGGSAAASLFVGADATLDAGLLSLGSSSVFVDFGAGTLGGLAGDGTALLPGGGVFDGPVVLGAGGLVDVNGILQAASAATTTGVDAVSFAAGSTIEGAGALIAGNFSESETIAGAGTIIARGPAPLTIAAGSIGGGAHLVVEPGAVLELGAVSPLYGVFHATPITIGSSATISFAPGASPGQDGGSYGSALGEQGGVLVLDYPTLFNGTIDGFVAGDRLAMGGWSTLGVFNVTTGAAGQFEVSGYDSAGTLQIATIHASLAAGDAPFVETLPSGGQVIGIRAASAELTLNDIAANQATIDVAAATPETLQGLGVLVPNNGTKGLTLTVSSAFGTLADGGSGASSLTLTAATALSLNSDLAALTYTPPASGTGDALSFTGAGGLAGLSAAIGVDIHAPGTIAWAGGNGTIDTGASWQGGAVPAPGDLAVLASHAGAPDLLVGPGEIGAVSVAGAYDLAGSLDLAGSSGTALDIGAGGMALFDANAVVTLGGTALVGDSAGAGTLGIAGSLTASGQAIAVGAAGPAGSRLDVTGSLGAGTLALGTGADAMGAVIGTLSASSVTLGFGTDVGTLRAAGTGATLLALALDIADGTLAVDGGATAGVFGYAKLTTGSIAVAGPSALLDHGALGLLGGGASVGALATLSVASLLTVAAGASLLVDGVATGATFDSAGATTLGGGATLDLTGSLSLAAGATLGTDGGRIGAPSGLAIAAGATLTGHGAIGAVPGTFGVPTIDAAGVLEATGGRLILGGDLAGNATIGAGATLAVDGSAAGGTISFAGTQAVLAVADPRAMTDAIVGFTGSDAIDLVGVAPSLVSVAAGTVTIADPGSFALTTASGAASPSVSSDGAGGSLITAGGEMPCFARGTRLLTPNGYRPVEALRPGDALVTACGMARPIVWIGWRVVDLGADPDAEKLRPVVVEPGAFGPNQPRRRLLVSPLHAIVADGALVPAALLVNGATIRRAEAALAVTYFHVELDRHDVVVAEGLTAESYRDTGNRRRFAASRGTPGPRRPACARLLVGGQDLAALRRRLHDRAIEAGYRIVHDAPLMAETPWGRVKPRRVGRRAIIDLPHRVPTQIRLRTAARVPADTDPDSEDRRALGLCVGALATDLPGAEVRFGTGWLPRGAGDRGVWMEAAAELVVAHVEQ